MEEENIKNIDKSSKPWLMLSALVLVVVVGLILVTVFTKHAGLKTNQMVDDANTSKNVTSPTVTPVSKVNKEVMVEGNEFAFTPSAISLTKGEPVTLTFKNSGKYPHNLSIKGLNVATKVIMPGQTDTVSFVPQTAGEFEYLCTVGNHAEKGMVGKLTVN